MPVLIQSNEAAPHTSANTLMHGYLSKSVAGASDVTLSDAEAQHMQIDLTGTLTGDINVNVPDDVKRYSITNLTTGAYTLTVKTVAGSGVAVTQNKTRILHCDGTDVLDRTPLS